MGRWHFVSVCFLSHISTISNLNTDKFSGHKYGRTQIRDEGIFWTLIGRETLIRAEEMGMELIAFMNPEDILKAMTPEKHETILKFLLKMYDTAGSGVEVLLNMAKYRQLSQNLESDSDLLIGLSEAELGALAASKLVPSTQTRLNELLRKNTESQLSSGEEEELDNLLEYVDQLTTLKTRAGYTTRHAYSAGKD